VASLIARSILAVTLAGVMASVTLPSPVQAQDGSPAAAATQAPTCGDRFPAEGPAGVDLRLGCIIGELVGLYTASDREDPPTLSAYVIALAVGLVLGLALVAAALRLLARRASRRLAPVTPSEWWVCPSCSSVNGTAASRCYACGGPPGDGPTMTTDPDPVTAQQLGGSTRR
jgi:hypothetical protein